ncbi:MAG TPA: hypothetical protein PKY73_09175 [Hyphomonas sp.]|nr:hypothetical protein [Hyphomonas sp.]
MKRNAPVAKMSFNADQASNRPMMLARETGSRARIRSTTALPMLARAMSSVSAIFSKSLVVGIFTISLSRRLSDASDGRSHPAQTKGESAGRGGNLLRSMGRLARALDDHWVGDLIGAVCLFSGICGILFLGFGMGWR